MKNVGFKMFVKKFTACALAAAMTISTPVTAFAADFSDNFLTPGGANESDSETGTVSSTDTNTTILKDKEKITDLIIYGDASRTMAPGDRAVLTAAVLTTGGLEHATPAQLNEKIRWKSSAPSVVSISAKRGSMNKCELNARKAGSTTITASLDADQDGKYDYMATVQVEVFEASENNISWNITDKFYVKHTYCLSDYLEIDGNVNAMDVVTFAVKGSPKVATISGDMLTIKGVGDITLSAVLPNHAGTEILSEKITTKAGNPVKKLTASESKLELDFNKDGVAIAEPTAEVFVDIVTADGEDEDGDKTTDEIKWTSGNPSVADVERDFADQAKAVITAKSVGKTTITAKSTSGKTAKFSVTVKATLISIDSVTLNNDSGYAWSGKTDELIIERTPEQNKDKLKVTSDDKRVKVKSTVNNVTITPANDLKLAASEDEEENADSLQVTITVESSDKYSDAEPREATITVKQSNFKIKEVIDNYDGKSMELKDKKTVRTNPPFEENEERILSYTAFPDPKYSLDASVVSWVSSNVKVATINNGELKIVGQGTAKITASSVYAEKGKYKQIKKSFTVKSTPGCETIVLKSNTAAYDLSKAKKKAVTINVKQQLPKKANDEIEWYINGVKQTPSKNVTDKKLVVQPKEFSGMKEGTVEVMAVSKMNKEVYAVATIYVVKKPAKKVEFTKYKKGVTLKQVGNVMEIPAPTVTEKNCNDPIVSYTVDKKGTSVVKAEMTKDGNLKLTGVGEGKATVTALTASGKKGTLKVKVAVK